MPDHRFAEAVLITGVYGSGKTSVAEEIAVMLERRRVPFAALDLDWLDWFDTGSEVETEHRMMLRNLASVVGNYLAVGVRYLVLAGAIRNASELESLKAVLPMPVRVVRLIVPLPEIERRLRSDVTTGRKDDLREAAAWLAASRGAGVEDLTVSNEHPIRQVGEGILDWLGWT